MQSPGSLFQVSAAWKAPKTSVASFPAYVKTRGPRVHRKLADVIHLRTG